LQPKLLKSNCNAIIAASFQDSHDYVADRVLVASNNLLAVSTLAKFSIIGFTRIPKPLNV
jgi:hypothetical protein